MSKEQKAKRKRRNYAKEFEHLSLYLDTVLRIKTPTPEEEQDLEANDYRRIGGGK